MTDLVELRSDTFTRPTPAMRQAMYDAEVGDDVWGTDPTVHRLEALAAELTGKATAVFVTSGTQGNLAGVLSHVQRGDEVILGERAHILNHEAGGVSVVGGVQVRTLPNHRGRLDPAHVAAAIRPDDEHCPRTGLVALENTHNAGGGAVLSRDEMAAVAAVAHGSGIPVHLDGARIFNAAVALDVPVAQLVEPVDSVTFCLSKGLGAPVGSILCGSEEYIKRARRWRKLLGGGLRQSGILAAAGLVALTQHVDRLAEDHANARRLAEGLTEIPGIALLHEVETNIVYFDVSGTGLSAAAFVDALAQHGVMMGESDGQIRAVTSLEVNAADIDRALHAALLVARGAKPVFA